MAQWFYTVNGQQAGPVDDAQLRSMIQSGQVRPMDLVWREGMANWAEVHSVPEFGGLVTAASMPQQDRFQYQQQPGYGPPIGYESAYVGGTPPKNYLVEAVLVTLCCCMPFGIVSIVYAAQVNTKWNAGDHAGAVASAEAAKKWALWGLITGVIANAILVGLRIAIESA